MITENAQAIVNFLDFLNSWPSSHAFVIKVEDDVDRGTIVTVYCDKMAYRHQLNALMAILDEMTGIVTIYKVNEYGQLSWQLW